MQMTCPKCHGDMRAYERNGVTVDQCTDCRGIFLDRGELERLTTAENAWHGGQPAQQQNQQQPHQPHQSHQQHQQYQQPHYQDQRYQDQRYQDQRYQQGYSYGGHKPHKKKRESFFEELFD